MIDKNNIRILFMGTPDFACESLKALVDNRFNVVGVFTKPDKPSGRGMKMQMSIVKQYAIDKNIVVYTPIKFKNNPEIMDIIKKLNPNVICVAAYGKILPSEVLDYPKYGCINVHGSLLPKYRGAAPIQWSIINGDKYTGITTMYMDEGMDTGNMLLKEKVNILDSDNYQTLTDKLKIVGAKLLVETLNKLIDGSLERIKQDPNYTLAPMIEKSMGKLDFNKKGIELFNLVRGMSPTPGTYFFDKNNKRYKVYQIEYINQDISGKNGEVLNISDGKFSIKCCDGYINIKIIQPENSKKMDVEQYINGNKIKLGDILN